jgi:hypothetical protein
VTSLCAIKRHYDRPSVPPHVSKPRHRRLKIATFDDLNDPFELWAVAQPNPALRRGLRRWKEEIARTYGVLCFSKSWDNPVLWSHYADRHRGIALGFDVDSSMARGITYTKIRPPFRRTDEAALDTLLYTKHRDWQYEKEVRVFARLEEREVATGAYFGDFNEHIMLREIITGPLCAINKHKIDDALRDEHVAITKGRLAFNTFNVVADQRGLQRAN